MLNARVWNSLNSKSKHSKEMQNILRENKSVIAAVHSNENRHALNWICVLRQAHANSILKLILCIAEIEKSSRSRIPVKTNSRSYLVLETKIQTEFLSSRPLQKDFRNKFIKIWL